MSDRFDSHTSNTMALVDTYKESELDLKEVNESLKKEMMDLKKKNEELEKTIDDEGTLLVHVRWQRNRAMEELDKRRREIGNLRGDVSGHETEETSDESDDENDSYDHRFEDPYALADAENVQTFIKLYVKENKRRMNALLSLK